MFNPTQVVIEAFEQELQATYARVYGVLEADYPGILVFIGRVAIENIANSGALPQRRASGRAGFITGSSLTIDGGYVA
jgi:hypothetical protein